MNIYVDNTVKIIDDMGLSMIYIKQESSENGKVYTVLARYDNFSVPDITIHTFSSLKLAKEAVETIANEMRCIKLEVSHI